MTPCHIALGGNRGDVPAAFAAALRRLDGPELRIGAVSRVYTTPPMGSAAGGIFSNAAASLETSLDPVALLDRLLSVEDALGRSRDVRWGPRSLDLDLIFYGSRIIDAPRLRVPHPGCWYRRFVLDPLEEIAAHAIHPEAGQTVRDLRLRLLTRPFLVACDDGAMRDTLEAEMKPLFPDVIWTDGSNDATLRLSVARPDDAAQRVIAVSRVPAEFIATAQAVLIAALSDPLAAASPGPSVANPSRWV